MTAYNNEKIIERYHIADQLIDGGTDTAVCMFILQKYAGLTFNEAWAYLAGDVYGWWKFMPDKSRQSIYRLKKRAREKIAACDEPVLKMIEPFAAVPSSFIID